MSRPVWFVRLISKTFPTRFAMARATKLPLIGRAPAMQEVYRVMARVAGTDLTVLVEGESGTGKERVARAIHDHSRRATGPFVIVSLAGAAPAQIDRELFGPDGKFQQFANGHAYKNHFAIAFHLF